MKITKKDKLFITWGEFEGSTRYSICKWTGQHFKSNGVQFIILVNQNATKKEYTLPETFLVGKVQNLAKLSSSDSITLNI